MTEINANWDNAMFGIDTDGKLKLIMDIESEGKIPIQAQLILAANCLSNIIEQNNMKPKQVFAIATMQSYAKVTND